MPLAELEPLYTLIRRFQSLKNRTGTSKSSSYALTFNFDPWDELIYVEWGTYDVGDYPRTHRTRTRSDQLLTHLAEEIEKMEAVVAAEEQDVNNEASFLPADRPS